MSRDSRKSHVLLCRITGNFRVVSHAHSTDAIVPFGRDLSRTARAMATVHMSITNNDVITLIAMFPTV